MESLGYRVEEDLAPVSDERSDEALVLLALRDPAHFALLYRRYAVGTYRYCDRCLGNREDAEEATQTVFLRALASLGTCRHPEAFRSWLFAIAHNVIVSTRMAKRPAVALDLAEMVHDAGSSPEDLAIAAIERRDITRLLAQLPAGATRACRAAPARTERQGNRAGPGSDAWRGPHGPVSRRASPARARLRTNRETRGVMNLWRRPSDIDLLAAFWNDRAASGPSSTPEIARSPHARQLDPTLTDTVGWITAADDAQPPDPAFLTRLEQTLMESAQTMQPVWQPLLEPAPPSPNGRAQTAVTTMRPRPGRRRSNGVGCSPRLQRPCCWC